MFKKNHYFSGINYATTAGSTSHKIRLVTNSSSNHMNGSLNSHIPKAVNLFRNSRGKSSSEKCCGLFLTDLASGLSEVQLMDGSTAQNVTRAITAFSNKNRIPTKIVVDTGPQLKAMLNNRV